MKSISWTHSKSPLPTYLVQTGVLDVVRRHCLLSLDLHTYVHPDGSWDGRLICSLICQIRERQRVILLTLFKYLIHWRQILVLFVQYVRASDRSLSPLLFSNPCNLTQVVPHIHLPAERSDLDDCLTQEVVALAFEPLFYARFNVIILVPHPDLDAVGWVVTFAAGKKLCQKTEDLYSEYWNSQ